MQATMHFRATLSQGEPPQRALGSSGQDHWRLTHPTLEELKHDFDERCWRNSNTICRPAVQGFVGSLVGFGATKGVFVTASTFSSGAVSYARNLPQRVILIDGNRLADLMIEHGVGTRPHRTIQVQRLDEDFFSEDG